MTTLSIYNSDYLCFAHADEATRARFDGMWSARTRQERQRLAIEPQTHTAAAFS